MKQKQGHAIEIILTILLATITYIFVVHCIDVQQDDYWGHAYIWVTKFTHENLLQAWIELPHCLWHLSVLFFDKLFLVPREPAAAMATCVFVLFAYFIVYWMILKITEKIGNKASSTYAALVAFAFSVVQAIYIPWLDAGGPYIGSFSINPIHNPTQTCVRPFVLLCFCLVFDIWSKQKNTNYKGVFFKVENGLKKYYIALAVLLFLSTVAKPTFAEMFVPTVAFIMLGELLSKLLKKNRDVKEYFSKCLYMLLCATPALLYICLQFVAFYIVGGGQASESSVVITEWFEIWGLYSENIFLSVLLAMAFPIFVIFIDAKYFLSDDMGRLALVSYAVSFLEASLLGETGARYTHGNFIWPLMSGMLIVWIVSIMRLLVLERTKVETMTQKFLIDCAWVLFWLHVAFGIGFILINICLPGAYL